MLSGSFGRFRSVIWKTVLFGRDLQRIDYGDGGFDSMATVDPELLEQFRKLPCMACMAVGDTHVHHIKTRGSGGGDDPWNLLPLCASHHTSGPFAWHQAKGYRIFLMAFPHVWHYMRQQGWEIYNGKLLNAKNAEDISILKHKTFKKKKFNRRSR